MTSAPAEVPELSVSRLELFLDLVFVFTITQLTSSLSHHLTVEGLVRVLVMLAVIWWMYDGFIWVANAMPPSTHPRRGLLLLAMSGFLVMSMAIPDAFTGSGVAFGWAYVMLVAVHAGMFAASGLPRASIVRMALIQALNAALVVVGGYFEGNAQLALWGGAFAIQFVTPYLVDMPRFRLRAGHFVERHALIVIVAFGESVVAIGVGAGDAPLEPAVVAAAVLTLAVCVGLWWAYFGEDDDERAAGYMAALTEARRNHLAIRIYNVGHYALLLGVLLVAVGAKSAVAHPVDRIGLGEAAALAAGTALFLVANTVMRRTLGLVPLLPRAVAALLALATIPLGAHASAFAQLGALVGLLALTFLFEERAGGAARGLPV
ncbi:MULTISPECIES: low temperature requirement protein A [Streptomyces]|uniref:low temperature requirement protein A n=1 Tax=Streptomyces TaxID=1883 RepID=UPI00052418F0|nr:MULTISPECIES: low temperature requirement protein A [Streptomyces]